MTTFITQEFTRVQQFLIFFSAIYRKSPQVTVIWPGMGQGGRLRVMGNEAKQTSMVFKRPPGRANYVKELATAQGAMTNGPPEGVSLPQPDPKVWTT